MFGFFRGVHELAEADLDTPASVEIDASLSLPQRSALIADWVASVAGATREAAASDLSRLLGLSFGRSRLAEAVSKGFRTAVPDATTRLGRLYEVEVQASAQKLVEAVPAESLRVVASTYGPLRDDNHEAARIYLLSRRLRAIGNRTLAAGIAAALHGGLDGLTPVASFGPLRLQTRRAMRDLRDPRIVPSLLGSVDVAKVSRAEIEHPRRKALVESLLRGDIVPRVVGTFLRPDQPVFAIAFEHPARSVQERARLAMRLLSLLEELVDQVGGEEFPGAVEPLAIDLWLMQGGKLRRSLGWRQLGSEPENLGFMKSSMVGFVEGSEQVLPLEALGRPLVDDDARASERRRAPGEMMDQPKRTVIGGRVVEMFSVLDAGDWDNCCPDCGHEFADNGWTSEDIVTQHATCAGCDRVWVLSKLADSPGGAVVTFTRMLP